MSDERLHPSAAGGLLDKCPREWRHWVDRDWRPNKAMIGGSALHSAVLGGAQIIEIEFDSYRTKDAKAARDEALAAGDLPVLSKDVGSIMPEALAVRGRLDSEHTYSDLVREKTIQWESDGVLLEGTPDALDLSKRQVIELKRTASIPRFGNIIADKHYDLQAAAYVEAAQSKYGGIWSHKFLVAQEGEPYCTRFDYLSATGIALGERKWELAKSIFKACAHSGEWPDYTEETHDPKPWQLERFGL